MEEVETSPPLVLDYSKAKPLGYHATQKLTRFFPISSLPSSDIVRFIINSQGYWDPYSSYLRITVAVKTPDPIPSVYNSDALGACQLDSSASSLIQTLSFIQGGVEIERIDRYDVLTSILADMFYSKEQRAQRAHEGFGTGLPNHMSMKLPTGENYIANGTTSAAGQLTTDNLISITGMPIVGAQASTSNIIAGNAIIGANVTLGSPYFDGCNEPVMHSAAPVAPAGSPAASYSFTTMTFCIPIISGIFGVLMPADEIKYIPMVFFPNLEMNFRLNPYAFHNLKPVGGPAQRNFQVTGCELFVNIIHFQDSINRSIVSMVKERGMYMHTCSYYYGPSHMIAGNGSFETYPINMSFKSLRSIIWCFIPSNYRTLPYVRALRRKALNLTSAQVRIGGELYPTFPVGNLGASSDSGNPFTNSDFLANTYKSFGRLHDTVNDSLVTSHTFASGNLMVGADYALDAATFADKFEFAMHTKGFSMGRSSNYLDYGAAGLGTNVPSSGCLYTRGACNWWQNQIVPRAVFGIDLDTITSDDSVISGVNTLINKPFELLLEGRNPTNETCELNMFLYYDFVVMIDRDFTVKPLGRGG